ncbi:MAG TPA: hypothetical protein VKP30_14395 [Polyangiaceae bacterium]|nr:hypothetical protein [Polyangiaceae bacterium]
MTNQDPYVPSDVSVPPSSGPAIWVTVAVGLACLSVGLGVSFLLKEKSADIAVTKPCASVSASAEKPKVEPSVVERAAAGDLKAMDELSAIAAEQRNIEQAVALSKGRAVQKMTALDLLRENLEKSADGEGLKKLMQFAQDGDTARSAIGIAATLSGSKGCDLLYELTSAKGTAPEMALLAGQFLSSKDVRSKASPALALVLDLRDATTCEQRKQILEKAVDAGDRRIVRHIVPLTKKTGCGAKKTEDCNPCLREDNQKIIRDSMGKTQGRKSPSFS